MRKVIFAFCLSRLLLLATLGWGQEKATQNLRDVRLRTAEAWLKDIGVQFAGPIDRENSTALEEALSAWTKGGDSFPSLKLPESSATFRQLVPSAPERLGRVFDFKAELAQTPNYVFGVPQGATTSTLNSFLPNPDHGLLSFGGVQDWKEMFLTVENRTSICDAALSRWMPADVREHSSLLHHGLHCADRDYLSASRRLDAWGRIASAFSVNTTVAQSPRFQSGIVISPGFLHDEKWIATVTGTFDPSLLFHTASEWKTWGSYYSKHHKDLRFENASGGLGILAPIRPRQCNGTDTDSLTKKRSEFDKKCFDALAGGPMWQRSLSTFLPNINIKAYTPFDFVKSGLNTFIPVQRSNNALYDVTFTWNLRKLIPSAQNRNDAFNAYETLVEGKADQSVSEALNENRGHGADWKQQVRGLYEELANDPEIALNQAWWESFRRIVLRLT